MKDFIKKHSFIITLTALLDLFGCVCYIIWAEAVHAPTSALDAYVMIGVVIDVMSLIMVGTSHKDWFFKDNGEDQ